MLTVPVTIPPPSVAGQPGRRRRVRFGFWGLVIASGASAALGGCAPSRAAHFADIVTPEGLTAAADAPHGADRPGFDPSRFALAPADPLGPDALVVAVGE